MVFQDDHCEKCGKKYTTVKYKWCESCQINYLEKNFTNWTSGNEIVDNFIQEFQLKINDYNDIIIEWIPYDQLNNIKEIRKDGFSTIYSTIWEDGPLYYCLYKKEYKRKLGKKQVALKYMHNSQNITNELLSKGRNSNALPIYGISQNPDTKDYIIVIQDEYCEKCGEEYTNIFYKWCKPCQISNLKENFINWTSGNEKVDNFIQDRQLNHIDRYNDPILEWISYEQFDNIKEISKNGIITICTAIWKSSPLNYDINKKIYKRDFINQNKKVTLICYNTQDIIEFLSKDNSKLYRIDNIYGLTQNLDTKDYIMFLKDKYCEKCGEKYTNKFYKWCKPCEINYLKKNFTNWTSGNEKVNNFIQEFQLKINRYNNIIVEWIPYNQFDNIKEIGKNDLFTIYSAIWKNGQLIYDKNERIYKRNLKNQNEIVTLKSFNSQNITEEFFNKSNNSVYSNKIYGVSQNPNNPNTKNYIIVIKEIYCENCGKEYTDTFHKWCKPCQISNLKKNFTNWTSKNEKIDKFIQEMQLKNFHFTNIIVEWIPYEQFNNIKKINKDDYITICSAIWKNGQLNYDQYKKIYQRNLKNKNQKITLKFYNLQDNADKFFNEANDNKIIYGISQNPDTKDYIMVIENIYCEKCSEILHDSWCKSCQLGYLKKNSINWTSGNKKIDELIQEMQLKINDKSDTIFEWIPHNQFNKIEEIGKGGFAIVYSAIWKDGPLFYKEKFRRMSGNSSKVALKYLLNSSQNIIDEFLNEIRAYSLNYNENIIRIYGLSQEPNTKDYIIVLGYARGGNLYYQLNKNYDKFNWTHKLDLTLNIITGLINIHQKQMVHRDFHVGNLLVEQETVSLFNKIFISDMGLCGEVSNIKDESKIYGVMPYVAPEVLKGKPYTQAADIYSLGMIMYFIATGKQPFANCAHDEFLVLNICNGIRPEINESEIPKIYIDIMKKCWDSNPNNRPRAIDLEKSIRSFYFGIDIFNDEEIKKQFEKAEEYRKVNLLSIKSNQSTTHPEAHYTSRLLNPFTKNLYSMEVIDFTK
ncbi:Rad53p [Rhizophagus irregularis DAOM 197198w]|uniref:non-specific serine/threonine protein kinase n=2 Tax=Rhizophagus irregularis TaxID=588596 RepID=A0A015KC47_RHIIW|nr:Rad53p [Rhizophagus irregularis DAOM 197198w]